MFLIKKKKKVVKSYVVIHLNGKFYRRGLKGSNISSFAASPLKYHEDYAKIIVNGETIFNGKAQLTWISGRHYPKTIHCFIEPNKNST